MSMTDLPGGRVGYSFQCSEDFYNDGPELELASGQESNALKLADVLLKAITQAGGEMPTFLPREKGV